MTSPSVVVPRQVSQVHHPHANCHISIQIAHTNRPQHSLQRLLGLRCEVPHERRSLRSVPCPPSSTPGSPRHVSTCPSVSPSCSSFPPLAAFKYSLITPGVFFAYKRILSPSASMLLSSGVLPFACRDISDTRFCSLTGRSPNVQRSCMSILRLRDVDRSYKLHRSYKSSCCRIHPAPRLASFFAGIPVREVPRVHHAVRCGEFVSGLGFSSALWPPPLDDALFVLSMCSGLMVARSLRHRKSSWLSSN